MNIAQLRTLVAIADSANFTVAASSLFLTPSAISHQMKELEEELETALFDRSTRPPRLNAHGRAVVTQGREVLLQFDALVDIARSPGEISGQLKLGCVSGVSSDLIPAALAQLRNTHPSVHVRMEEGLSDQLAERVRRRELDAAIITELPDPDPKLQSLPIVEESLFVVAPVGTTASHWRDALSMHPFIRLNRSAGMGTLIDRALRNSDLALDDVMELDSSEAIVGMAKAGLGAGVVPGGRLKHVPADSVVVLPFGTPHLKRRVVLVERRDHARSDLSKLVFHALKQVSG